MKTLHVSAGGRGERIASYIATISPLLPKHLLPLPTAGGSLLGEIVLKGIRSFEEVKVWTSKETYPRIVFGLERLTIPNVVVDAEMTGPLGPLVRSLFASHARTYGCAGDYYCDFSWDAFENFHDTHDRPVSILVAKSVAAPKGAKFYVRDGLVSKWERVERTRSSDLINIGCYIVDPKQEVLDLLEKLNVHKEDEFFDLLIEAGLVAGYDPGVRGFNVNVAEVYESLLHALA